MLPLREWFAASLQPNVNAYRASPMVGLPLMSKRIPHGTDSWATRFLCLWPSGSADTYWQFDKSPKTPIIVGG